MSFLSSLVPGKSPVNGDEPAPAESEDGDGGQDAPDGWVSSMAQAAIGSVRRDAPAPTPAVEGLDASLRELFEEKAVLGPQLAALVAEVQPVDARDLLSELQDLTRDIMSTPSS